MMPVQDQSRVKAAIDRAALIALIAAVLLASAHCSTRARPVTDGGHEPGVDVLAAPDSAPPERFNDHCPDDPGILCGDSCVNWHYVTCLACVAPDGEPFFVPVEGWSVDDSEDAVCQAGGGEWARGSVACDGPEDCELPGRCVLTRGEGAYTFVSVCFKGLFCLDDCSCLASEPDSLVCHDVADCPPCYASCELMTSSVFYPVGLCRR